VSRPPRIFPSPKRAIGALLGVVVLGAPLFAAPAYAYVRARSDAFSPVFWPDPRQALQITIPPDGLGVTALDLRMAAQAAIAAWSYPALSCTGVALRLNPEYTESQVAGRDHTNRIIMRTGAWCRDPIAMTHCRDSAIVAVTTVFTRVRPGKPDDGLILEADIEVNATGDYRWTLIPDGPISGRDYANLYDLTSVLTHETGHFIGLDHNCLLPQAAMLIDDKGNPQPACSDIPSDVQAQIVSATMYPFMNPTDVTVRSLTADDQRAACEIYPPSSVPLDEWTGAGGCSTAPGPTIRGALPACVGAVLAMTPLLFALLSVGARRRSGHSNRAAK
jgi:hypothetical protein